MKRFLLLLITAWGVVLLSGCSTPETTVRKYITASFSGDLMTAKGYCDGNALKMVEYHQELQESIGAIIPGIAGEMTGLPSEGSADRRGGTAPGCSPPRRKRVCRAEGQA